MSPSDYKWIENNACVATYKVLERDEFLDQFDGSAIAFDAAGAVRLGSLKYFPKTTTNSEMLRLLSMEMARKFLEFLTKVYVVKKERQSPTSEVIAALADVFADGSKTICDLAAVADAKIKFPDEP